MINFLAELSVRFDHEIHLTPSNGIARQNNIYELDINSQKETASYWTDWGGEYDNFQGTQIEIYFGRFLRKVYTIGELLDMPNSLYVRSDLMVFVHIPMHPWLYPDQSVEAQNIDYFLYAALNPDNPSNNRIKGTNTATRLALPNLTVRLSDNVNGITLNQAFSVSLSNNDGYFDNEEIWNIFNTPLRLKKATADNPEYDDFKDIRNGLVENTVTSFDSFQIDVADKFRSMENPVCDIITKDRYGGIEIDEKTLNKNIPVVYGQKRVKLQKLNEFVAGVVDNKDVIKARYIAAEYVREVIGVYDSSGASLSYSLDEETGIITSDNNADAALISGWPNNKISDIIKDLVTRKAGIPYGDSNWNTLETERYAQAAYRVNIVIEGGNVKNAIQAVLKNDMAYFIHQGDGKFTIRKYGREYATIRIPSWEVTKKPEKTWGAAQENYFSSCIINYDRANETFKSLLFNDWEVEAEDTYRRLVTRTFDTDLVNRTEAEDLAVTLSERYSRMMQTIKVAVGIDTSGFQLLDRIVFDAGINGRKFSKGEYFFIKEIDPAQDILTLEEFYMWDFTGEYYDTEDHEYDVDHMYAYTPDEDYEYVLEGGIL